MAGHFLVPSSTINAPDRRQRSHIGLLMGVYALGMAVPLVALALLWDQSNLGRRRRLRGRIIVIGPFTTHTTSLVNGLLMSLPRQASRYDWRSKRAGQQPANWYGRDLSDSVLFAGSPQGWPASIISVVGEVAGEIGGPKR